MTDRGTSEGATCYTMKLQLFIVRMQPQVEAKTAGVAAKLLLAPVIAC